MVGLAQVARRPAGTFSLLFGSGPELGIALVTDPRIKAVGFTGSRSGGLALVAAAAARPEPIPVYAEMSSINPVFLLEGALRGDPRPHDREAGAVAGLLVLGQRLSPVQLGGMALVVLASVLVLGLGARRTGPSPEIPV